MKASAKANVKVEISVFMSVTPYAWFASCGPTLQGVGGSQGKVSGCVRRARHAACHFGPATQKTHRSMSSRGLGDATDPDRLGAVYDGKITTCASAKGEGDKEQSR